MAIYNLPSDTVTQTYFDGQALELKSFIKDKTTLFIENQVCIKNMVKNTLTKNAPGVGIRGGKCTCPNGQSYFVGAYDNDCSRLACISGVTPVNIVLTDQKDVSNSSEEFTSFTAPALCMCPNGEKHVVGEITSNPGLIRYFACDNGVVTRSLLFDQEMNM